MKQLILFCGIFFTIAAHAQTGTNYTTYISVSSEATTIVMFPASIVDADLGTAAVLMEPFTRGENVLRLKALHVDFNPSNLSVITDDGRLYHFAMVYEAIPYNTKFDFTTIHPDKLPPVVVRFPGNQPPPATIDQTALLIAELHPRYHSPRDKAGAMQLALSGIYLQQNMLYFRLDIHNLSGIPYRPDGLRIFIRDRRKQKRSSERVQELKTHALFMPQEVAAHQKEVWVAVFPLFTITDSKILYLQVGEQNGDRGLTLRIRGAKLLQSRSLSY